MHVKEENDMCDLYKHILLIWSIEINQCPFIESYIIINYLMGIGKLDIYINSLLTTITYVPLLRDMLLVDMVTMNERYSADGYI